MFHSDQVLVLKIDRNNDSILRHTMIELFSLYVQAIIKIFTFYIVKIRDGHIKLK